MIIDLLSRFTYGIEKADVMRLMILYLLGGFYMDLDVECHRPLNDYLQNNVNVSLIFDQERNMQSVIMWKVAYISMNSVIVSRPSHPFLKQLIDKFPSRAKLGENHFPQLNFCKHEIRKLTKITNDLINDKIFNS